MSATKTVRGKTRVRKSRMKRKAGVTATAFHGQDSHGKDVVGIGNLRVVLVEDGEFWFAQGLEIDYAAQGTSVADVKKQFQDGICATVHEHLRIYGNIEHLLKPAPAEIWKEMLYAPNASVKKHSQISWHSGLAESIDELPFDNIEYLEHLVAA